jgi:hypothetical protein
MTRKVPFKRVQGWIYALGLVPFIALGVLFAGAEPGPVLLLIFGYVCIVIIALRWHVRVLKRRMQSPNNAL